MPIIDIIVVVGIFGFFVVIIGRRLMNKNPKLQETMAPYMSGRLREKIEFPKVGQHMEQVYRQKGSML